jgi:putative endonuclease
MAHFILGVTSDLPGRVWQHKEGIADGFTRKYGCKTLVWFEEHGQFGEAIRREKQMKEWQRIWKLRVIEEANPDWNDLYESFVLGMGQIVIPAKAGTQPEFGKVA